MQYTLFFTSEEQAQAVQYELIHMGCQASRPELDSLSLDYRWFIHVVFPE
jgi:hypothetical protein